MSNREILYLSIIGLLLFTVGFVFYLWQCKRVENIVKVETRSDMLPESAPGLPWIPGGMCQMNDGTFGKVDDMGKYCQQVKSV